MYSIRICLDRARILEVEVDINVLKQRNLKFVIINSFCIISEHVPQVMQTIFYSFRDVA